MIQQVTKGVQISVSVNYENNYTNGNQLHHVFTYCIKIDNKGKDTLQLLSRFWEIKETIQPPKIIKGIGVLGRKPIIKSQESYNYHSNCIITSQIGCMSGNYTMVNFTSTEKFKVEIPAFSLTVPFIQN